MSGEWATCRLQGRRLALQEHTPSLDVAASLQDEKILKRYEKWKDIVRLSGPPGLRAINGFHDEALTGEWKGCRSSRLGLQWRVIYQVVADRVLIPVVQVTAHDYRRP